MKTIKTTIIFTLLGTFLTIIFTYPLILGLSTFFDETGDLVLCSWILNHTFEAIKNNQIWNQNQYFSAGIFFPLKNTFAFSEHMFVPGLIYSGIHFILQDFILSFNIFLLSTFIFTFLSSFFVLNKFIKNKLAATLGAVIFTFNPMTFAHFPGHVQLMNKYFLPLVFYFAIQFFSKPNKKNACLFGLFFTMNALCSVYYQFFALIMVIIVFCVYLPNFKNMCKYFYIFIPFAIILLYFNFPYLEVSKIYHLSRTVQETKPLSANLNSWIVPSAKNLLFGKFIPFSFASEKILFPGFIASFLALFGIINIFHHHAKTNKLILVSSFIVLVSSFIFTFGPNFKNINLPFYYLFEYFPFFASLRAPSRFGFIFYIPFSLFAAYASKIILLKFKSKLIFVILLILLIIENLNRFDLVNQKPMLTLLQTYQQKNVRVINFLKNKNTLHLPAKPSGREDSEAQYLVWPIFTHEKMMNGYSGFRPKEIDKLLNNVNSVIPEKKLKEFKKIHLNYIILHKKLFKTKPSQINLPIIFQDKNIIIFQIESNSTKSPKEKSSLSKIFPFS